jgi:tetratricopeptide (TPR) repeat protein
MNLNKSRPITSLPLHLIVTFFAIFLLTGLAAGETVTRQKEHAYQSSGLDTKITARALALEGVKRLLLEELASDLAASTDVRKAELQEETIIALLPGTVRVELLEEKWTGKLYYIKAKVTADPDGTARSLVAAAKDQQTRTELEKAKRKGDELWLECEKLRQQAAVGKAGKTKAESGMNARSAAKYQDSVAKISGIDWFQNAFALHQESKLQDAITAYTKSIELIPNYAEAYYRRGTALAATSADQKAIQDFNMAIELNPRYTWAYMFRGASYYKLANYQQAVTDLSKVVELKPDHTEAYLIRGASFHRLRNYQKAVQDFTKVIEMRPDYAEAYNLRGGAYFRLSEFQQAITNYTNAIELRPNHAALYYSRGIAYYTLKDYEQALTDFTRAIELNPSYAEAYAVRGATYGSLGKYERANEDLKIAARLGDKEAQTFLNSKGIKWE